MKKTLGGDRLGSGKKMKVDLHGYERSTHNLSYIWRSTMAAGTLVPFMVEVAQPGDTFDIDLDVDIKTHPTIGPLFGSYKIQLDIFQAPVRLYQGQLHNNKLGIGMNMAAVKLPVITLKALEVPSEGDIDNAQINPSCILSYLGIRGVGAVYGATADRNFNGLSYLTYWDIYKNYYSNKQEEIGAVIHTTKVAPTQTVDIIKTKGYSGGNYAEYPASNLSPLGTDPYDQIEITYTGARPILKELVLNTSAGQFTIEELSGTIEEGVGTITANYNMLAGRIEVYSWKYVGNSDTIATEIEIETFPLEDIDAMREAILQATTNPAPFVINNAQKFPYKLLLNTMTDEEYTSYNSTQEGLGIKTYNSDLLNNWLSTEWIDGAGGISEVTAIDTSAGSFTIDTLILSRKVYNMLNRIAVSGGTYDDWQDAVFTHDRYVKCESPIYHGGLIKELVFQEVVSNSASESETEGTQPLGTLAGRGVMARKHKGGSVTIKVDEMSYLMGIISLTPRIDYSQGNKWDINLKTMDDFHKPALDEIGFQELITEQMAWWDTVYNNTTNQWEQKSAGKQPAWLNYMTNVNQTRGNFAIATNEMFMTLNRRYSRNADKTIEDLTTYIDPSKFNFIFAQTSLDSQNFWAQISVDITARRKMSAKVMPNL